MVESYFLIRYASVITWHVVLFTAAFPTHGIWFAIALRSENDPSRFLQY